MALFCSLKSSAKHAVLVLVSSVVPPRIAAAAAAAAVVVVVEVEVEVVCIQR